MADDMCEKGACSFIPTYVFEDIVAAEGVDADLKELAELTLELTELEDLEREVRCIQFLSNLS